MSKKSFSSFGPASFSRSSRRGIFPIAAIAALVLFGGGYTVGNVRATAARNTLPAVTPPEGTAPPIAIELSKDVDFPLFWEVWQQVKARYVKQPVADGDLFHGSMEGLVASLGDPYSVYLRPKLADEFAKDLEGTFEGIGAEIGIKNNVITVIAPLPDTPADKAGLRAGDRILAIDGTTTAGMTVEQAVSLIRGKGGTEVALTILRNGADEPKDIKLTRGKIIVKSVRWEMQKTPKGGKVGWIQIRQFNDDTTSLFEKGVRELLRESPKGIIVDLRNNPGGYLDSAVDVASFWVTGPVVIERKYDGSETVLESTGTPTLKGVPTIVLVNQGSASGSEILAGALQDAGAATLVGEKTFGKGSVQDYQQLRGGAALKLTVAEWLTPKRRFINKEGIVPDHEVPLSEEDANADKDPQLNKAYELIERFGAKTAGSD